MKILVTGADGQLARSLIAAAGRGPLDVVAMGRPSLDITRPEAIAAALASVQPDLLVNAAAYTAVDKAESEPELAYGVNAVGAGNVAAASIQAGIPLIHISTDYVFDGAKPAPYVESDLTEPATAYGRSKLAGEQAVAAACPHHLILRTAWVHSPFGHNFVRTMLRLATTRPRIGVVDDQLGSPTYAPHLAEALLTIAKRLTDCDLGAIPWGTYHAAGYGETTWCGLARAIFDVSARSGGPVTEVHAITTADFPTPARRPANSRLSCERLQRAFGVALPDWRAGVEDCVRRLTAAGAQP